MEDLLPAPMVWSGIDAQISGSDEIFLFFSAREKQEKAIEF
jgi:hypothetical protein